VSEPAAQPALGPVARLPTAFLLIAAAAAWVATVALARGMAGMSGMTGTMGLGLVAFVPVQGNRTTRIAGLVAGYLAVWAVAGLPAYGLARLGGWLAGRHPGGAQAAAVSVFALCGAYQLSSFKDRCLAHCRSPLGLLMHYGSYRGRLRDPRVGFHHGGYCLGCCWALMLILVAVGVMNVAAMVGLAALVLTEKTWRWGPLAGRLAGLAALGLAVATIWFPWLAPGLHAAPMMMS